MAIGGAFLGGGVELVPAGSCKLELEILTEDRANLTATFTIKGTSTYTVTAGADGRAVYTVPAGQTYTVSVNATGYDNIASQTVIAESGTVRYVRFEAIAGRVKRSGDTMTGTLTAPRLDIKSNLIASSEVPSENQFLDNSSIDRYGTVMVLDRLFRGSNGDIIKQLGVSDRSGNFHWVNLLAVTDGGDFATAPSWSPGTNDNSDKIMTIKMANSLPSLVHTTGNEMIAGVKTFNNDIILKTNGYVPLFIKSSLLDSSVADSVENQITFNDKNGVLLGRFGVTNYSIKSVGISTNWNDTWYNLALYKNESGTVYASAPTTPTGATRTEIVTANWAYDKLQRKITYGTGDPPSGGQAGDIYIKI